MQFHQLKRASDYEVEQWLVKKLELTPYQRDILFNQEIVRFSPFKFYQSRQKEKVPFWWRLTIFPLLLFIVLLFLWLPFNLIFTGRCGYGDKVYRVFAAWQRKVNLRT